jgi:hypothetical protein
MARDYDGWPKSVMSLSSNKRPFSGLSVLFRLLVHFFWKILLTFDVEFGRLTVVKSTALFWKCDETTQTVYARTLRYFSSNDIRE